MASATQEALVQQQFGGQAAMYLASQVHAEGSDLAALAALVRARPGSQVLDLGCGAGHVAFAAAQAGGQVTAYDLSAEMLAVVDAEARRRGLSIATVQGPAEALPFAAGRFDFVLSRYSAHHWRDFGAGLRETVRVLRAGGTAAFVDAVSPGIAVLDTYLQAAEVMRDISHVRDRSVAEWQLAATEAGLLLSSIVPGRLRLEFDSWIRRIATPLALATSIRALQDAMSETVRRHFAIEPDGSFTIDTALMVFSRP
jgi:ubiquinone/menaquinone biosynthesis C-methylase UbiE